MVNEDFKANVSLTSAFASFKGKEWSGLISPMDSEVFKKSLFSKFVVGDKVYYSDPAKVGLYSKGGYFLEDFFAGWKSMDSEHELEGWDDIIPPVEFMIDPEGSAELAAKVHIVEDSGFEMTVFSFILGDVEFFLVTDVEGYSILLPPTFEIEGYEYITL